MPEANLVMGFDYGSKRIGIAIGNRISRDARPLGVIPTANCFEAVGAYVKEWQPDVFVIGEPHHAPDHSTEEHALAGRARGFGNTLSRRFNIPHVMVNEHLSSWEAQRESKARGGADKDSLAAALIVETYLKTLS